MGKYHRGPYLTMWFGTLEDLALGEALSMNSTALGLTCSTKNWTHILYLRAMQPKIARKARGCNPTGCMHNPSNANLKKIKSLVAAGASDLLALFVPTDSRCSNTALHGSHRVDMDMPSACGELGMLLEQHGN
jgi:hypothetical protein